MIEPGQFPADSSRPTVPGESSGPSPIPPVSGRAYERAARVKVKLKGEADGPVYEGQNVVIPCLGCPK